MWTPARLSVTLTRSHRGVWIIWESHADRRQWATICNMKQVSADLRQVHSCWWRLRRQWRVETSFVNVMTLSHMLTSAHTASPSPSVAGVESNICPITQHSNELENKLSCRLFIISCSNFAYSIHNQLEHEFTQEPRAQFKFKVWLPLHIYLFILISIQNHKWLQYLYLTLNKKVDKCFYQPIWQFLYWALNKNFCRWKWCISHIHWHLKGRKKHL